ncbi:transketolase family protein [Magnetococcales bacterium HHB-1]
MYFIRAFKIEQKPKNPMRELSYIPYIEFKKSIEAVSSETLRAQLFATLCRINTLYMIAKAGSGHIGTCFSSLDILSTLFLRELNLDDGDRFFSSKGHDAPAIYNVLLGLGRLPFEQLHRLRRLDGLPGHPDIHTPGMVTNTGSLGMGISKAKGFIRANRLQNQKGRVILLTGDGELQEGQLWESLGSAVHEKMDELVVIVDNNRIQSDTWVEKVSDLGDLEAKFTAFGWHVTRCNGHNPTELGEALDHCRMATEKPSIIIADTQKGHGVSFMVWGEAEKEKHLYPYHSGAPDPKSYDRALEELRATLENLCQQAEVTVPTLEVWSMLPPPKDESKPQSLIAAYADALLMAAENNEKLVALDADLVKDCGLLPLRERFPDRFIECGIAEQDMVSQAGGLALSGLLPVAHSFACFLSTRPNEQIYNNASERTKIIYTGSLAGVLPAGPGHSHQSVRDIAALSGIPDLIQLEPSCAAEVGLVLDYAVNSHPFSSYIRLVSIPCEIPYTLPEAYQLKEGQGAVLLDTEPADLVVIGYGPVLLPQAYYALERLQKKGIRCKLINLPWLNRVDPQWLAKEVSEARQLITLDNHYIEGGQGQLIGAALVQSGLKNVRHLALGLDELPVCGLNEEALRHHGLDHNSLEKQFLSSLS